LISVFNKKRNQVFKLHKLEMDALKSKTMMIHRKATDSLGIADSLLYGTKPRNAIGSRNGNRATPHITYSGRSAVTNTFRSQDRSFALQCVERLSRYKRNQKIKNQMSKVEKKAYSDQGRISFHGYKKVSEILRNQNQKNWVRYLQ
jgi:hypothetical protein